ncbi:hypothetical protein JOL62DRAFT_561021, partial [Phyllosticta paracitricarpa]
MLQCPVLYCAAVQCRAVDCFGRDAARVMLALSLVLPALFSEQWRTEGTVCIGVWVGGLRFEEARDAAVLEGDQTVWVG